MMLATVHANPEDTVNFMLKYMENQYGDRASRGNKSTLQDMRNEADRLENQVKDMKEKTRDDTADKKSDKGSEHTTD